jgi:hypothetical protein
MEYAMICKDREILHCAITRQQQQVIKLLRLIALVKSSSALEKHPVGNTVTS